MSWQTGYDARPKTNDERELLEPVVMELLAQAPYTWSDIPNSLSSLQERAMRLLLTGKMVEHQLSMLLDSQDASYDAVIQETGELGWRDAHRQLCEQLKVLSDATAWSVAVVRRQWRLTDQGARAIVLFSRSDWHPLDYVLWQGEYDGELRRYTDGVWRARMPEIGHGNLVYLQKSAHRENRSDRVAVDILNVDEVAAEIANAMHMHRQSTPQRVTMVASRNPPQVCLGNEIHHVPEDAADFVCLIIEGGALNVSVQDSYPKAMRQWKKLPPCIQPLVVSGQGAGWSIDRLVDATVR